MSLSAANRRDLARAAWSGGLAIAMTGSVLVAGALLPTAVADHGDDPLLVESNITTCAQIALLPEAGPHGPFNPVTEDDNNVSPGEYDFLQATIEVLPGGQFLNVTPEPGHEITAVAVKGGDDSNVYFDTLTNLRAPDNMGGQQPTISHYTVCSKPANGSSPSPSPSTEPPSTEPPSTEPPSTEPPEEEDFDLAVLEPICDDDVPYLEYMIEPEGFEPTDVTITWINPDGEDVVYEDVPLAARILWPGAVTTEDGAPLDWPGWIQLEDGTWIEGDDGFEWVRPSVEVRFEVNPEQTVTVEYPPSSPVCAAEPPQGPRLPETGAANTVLGLAGGGLLAGGLVLMLLGRRRIRNNG